MSWEKGQSGNPGRQWVKGQSGNPRGSPQRGRALVVALRAALRQERPSGEDGYRAVVARLVDLAIAGDLDAIRLIFDRIDGRVPQAVALTGGEGGPAEIVLTWGEDPIRRKLFPELAAGGALALGEAESR